MDIPQSERWTDEIERSPASVKTIALALSSEVSPVRRERHEKNTSTFEEYSQRLADYYWHSIDEMRAKVVAGHLYPGDPLEKISLHEFTMKTIEEAFSFAAKAHFQGAAKGQLNLENAEKQRLAMWNAFVEFNRKQENPFPEQ